MTNGDVIRKATNEELSKKYFSRMDCIACICIREMKCNRFVNVRRDADACADTWFEWLSKEVEA